MPQKLTVELPDEVYQALTRSATRLGQTPEQWLIERLSKALITAEERAATMAKIWRHSVEDSDSAGGHVEPKG